MGHCAGTTMSAPKGLHSIIMTELRQLRTDALAERQQRSAVDDRIDKLEDLLSEIKFTQALDNITPRNLT